MASCDLILLAIKPQIAEDVLLDVQESITDDKLLITILAGVPTVSVENALPGKPRVIRAMPNTPALVSAGAAALCAGRHATANDKRVARNLFETVA